MNRALALQSAVVAAHPSLPPKMQRGDVERMISRCGDAFGLSNATIHILKVMMDHTRPSDWTSGTRRPVCFASQTLIADACNRSTKTIRNAEAALEDAGLILRRVGNGGQRGKWGDFTLGIDFAPLIARFHEIKAVYEERLALAQHCTILRKQISAARRMVRAAVAELIDAAPDHPAIPMLQGIIEAWPRRYAKLPCTMLEALLRDTESAYRQATEALKMSPEISGLLEENDRPLQDEIQDQTCSCSSTDHTPADQATLRQAETEAVCLEQARSQAQRTTSNRLANLTPARLYQAATPEFRLYLDGYSQGLEPDPLAFVKAAIRRCAELDIGGSAWDEACDVMGEPFAAALAVLVIDARRLDPIKPVKSAGGMLRGMTRCAAAGTLNLAGSLFALTSRSVRTHTMPREAV